MDYLRDVGGKAMVAAFLKSRSQSAWYEMTPDERVATRTQRSTRWVFPSDALDRATVGVPALLNERLDAFGIDFSIVYPTLGLRSGYFEHPSDLRRAVCRAHNKMSADMFADYADRMTPVAVIPMLTPEEAIDEVDYAVNELHLKAAMIMGTVVRPIPTYADAARPPTFVDNLVLDQVYDYEPLWQKLLDLKIAVTTHSGSTGWSDRRSSTNDCFNHVGHFAEANHTFARALFFSGVTYRYPQLNFAFLEGGVGWACNLLNDLIGHWHVRSAEALARMNPSNMDTDVLQRLYEEYGGKFLAHRAWSSWTIFDLAYPGLDAAANTKKDLDVHGGEIWDDFGAAHISNEGDILERFTKSSYFGCEADDPMTALAFDSRL